MPCNLDYTEYARSSRTNPNPALNGSGLAGTGKKKRNIREKVRTSSPVYRNTFGTPIRKTPSRFRIIIMFFPYWWLSYNKLFYLSLRRAPCVFSGIQFTRHFIEFVFVEMNQLFGSNLNVILSRQTCGQRSGMAAGSKWQASAFYFSVLIFYMSTLSKCRGE